MSEFKTPLDVRLLPETDDPVWILINPLVYYSDVMNCEIIVPSGFVTNFVSFDLLKNVGQRASVIHDYLYSCYDVDREIADKVLLEALEISGVDSLLADSMYIAVRAFGGSHITEQPYSFYGG